MLKKIILCLGALHFWSIIHAQNFKAGFDAREYADILQLCFKGFSDSSFAKLEASKQLMYKYTLAMHSPEVGLKNKCAVYVREDTTVIVVLRGTIAHADSWMANFFSGMIRAKGTFAINDSTAFDYTVAEKR